MKKVVYATISFLVVWNVYLTIEMFGRTQTNKIEQKIVETTLTGYTTDITETVAKCEAKVVTIENYQNEVVEGVGSGIIYEKLKDEVFIVTNYHVIEDSQRLVAIFANGVAKELEIVGYDEAYDVALLKTATDFDVEPFVHGDSQLVKKGEYAIAIGSPLGQEFAGSVSFGIVSGKDIMLNVDNDGDGQLDSDMVLLQSDAAMNIGNSGGALVNLNGELIGLNTLGLTGSSVQGMNFAIPINELGRIIDQLMTTGKVNRAYLGISGENVSELEIYEKSYLNLNIETNNGYLIRSLDQNGPASKAGLMVNDVIVKIDDKNINDFDDLRRFLYANAPETAVNVTYLRDNVEETVSVTLE
ncbi:MAG: S1C family serine protease [Erysipelotrichaceae bacterium]|nr:S1C family serine protease [Erysipelotrichaceae bacterium]MDY5251883.1 trypsin-like peptidase domain-containing protein [Erysipelotrichaceae bacterium]